MARERAEAERQARVEAVQEAHIERQRRPMSRRERRRTMKMGWRMRRERMISGLTTYFSFFCFFFLFFVLQLLFEWNVFVNLKDVGMSSEVAE